MKNVIKLLTILAIIFMVNSCKKDKQEDPIEYNLKSDYFTVQDATYIEKVFPKASSGTKPEIISVNGNTSVIPGGSNPIAIQTNGNIDKILVGVDDVGGYFSLPASNTKNTDYLFYILMNQNLSKDTFKIVVAVQDSNGSISEHVTIEVSLVEVGTGKLQISCAWNKLNDVDLHLVEPDGEEIYYGNGTSSNGGELDLDSNAGCSLDYVNNENITYGDQAVVESGEYIVRVDLWSACNVTDNTSYNVNVYYNGVQITPTTGTNPYQGSFTPNDADSGSFGDGVEVMRFNIPASRLHTETRLKFNYPISKRVTRNLSPQKER